MTNCSRCGEVSDFPYVCNYCGLPHCSSHRLPENHNCAGLRKTGMKEWSAQQNRLGGRGKTLKGGTRSRSERRGVVGRTGSKGSRGAGSPSKSLRNLIIVTVLALGLAFGGSAYMDLNYDVSDALSTSTPRDESSVGGIAETPEPTPAATPEPELDTNAVENMVHNEMNSRRGEHGLLELSHDQELRSIARQHSFVMADNQNIFHTQPDGDDLQDRFDQDGYSCRVSVGGNTYSTGGENVAQTWYETAISSSRGRLFYDTQKELAVGLVDQWMDSPGHRDNILKPYWENQGIGIVAIEQDGKTAIYATQVFC